MESAPSRCPMCGEQTGWKYIETTRKGYSVGKAVIGAFLIGPVGLAAGAIGKKKSTYACAKCGFKHEYDG